uniref:Ubiquitin-like domain-containing protein n=2 Tax=Castor canadensis TaxID=51338 RepID=A0A8C0ZLW1_CASCN
MSDQDDQFDSSEESDDAYNTVNVPAPSEQESDTITDEHESELDQFSESHETLEQSECSTSRSESNDEEQLTEEVVFPEEAEEVLQTLEHGKMQHAGKPEEHIPSDGNLVFLDKIKSIKESLQTSTRESLATVKVVLIPVGQEIIISFKVDTMFRHLKDHFSSLLGIPSHALQMIHAGTILKNNETLIQHGVMPQGVVQVELFSAYPDLHPIKRIDGLSDAPQVINVTIQTGINKYQNVAVEIIKSDFHKPFLGGFRHKITGTEYHNAGTQTVPKKIPEKSNAFCRDTQTVLQRKKFQQTSNTTSTQMTKIGVYVSNMTDKLIEPGIYFTAEEYHAQRLKATIVIQTYYRQWHAKVYVESLRRQKKLRLEWEAEEERRKIREKEEWIQLDYYRRHNPKTNEDFELLYNALERKFNIGFE